MHNINAIVGGEGSSGGVIIPPSKCRDGILTLLIVLSAIAKKKKKLEQIVDKLPKYYTLKEKIDFEMAKHDKIKSFIKGHYSKKKFDQRTFIFKYFWTKQQVY